MGDSGGFKRGRGQGRGRGRGGQGGQTQAIKNLERAATDIQNMLHKMKTSDNQDSGEGTAANKGKGNRGSKSLMNLSFPDGAPRGGASRGRGAPRGRGGPPNQNRGYQGPANQNPYPPPPPNHDPYYPHPPAPYQGQPPQYQAQPPHYQGQPPHYQGQPPQAPHYPGPPAHESYPSRPYHEGHPNQYAPPPPSYEESVPPYNRRPQSTPMESKPKGGGEAPNRGTSKQVTAPELVKALAVFEGQMADTEVISKIIESTPAEIEEIVKQRKDIFAHMKDRNKMVVELVPNISLCSRYSSESGCTARDTCQALHLCKSFIMAWCDQGPSCPSGHKLDTNHNTSILSKLYLDLIKPQNLLQIIRKVCRGRGPARMCNFYNTKAGCTRHDNCHFLHICKDYVMNDGKCSIQNCSFNHQLTHKQCKNVLSQHGVSTNESIRDILAKVKSSFEKSPGFGKNKKEESENEDSSDSDASQTPSEASGKKKKGNNTRDKTKENNSKAGEKGKGRNSTIKSTDFYGDVEIPEVCIYAVNNKCLNEKKGCKYLHAKSLFHWQVEKKNTWYNFRIFQSKTLESAYRDVSKSIVKLPYIDIDKLSSEDRKILELLGPNNWTADFKEMCIVDPTNSKLNIRRVSTASSAVSSLPQATVYEWYFEDENGKWICYGHVDSLGKQDLVSKVTSEDLEKQYVGDPTSSMIISNTRYKYKIDFTNMTQSNTSSMKMREIRRRPTRLAYQKTSAASDSTLPTHWQPMAPNQTHVLVTLDPNQAEFQEVSKGIKLMIPTAKIFEVRRLQNQYLRHLFQYKKADLSNRYDDLTMNVQKLYHGTDSDSINSISKENIDGRRYGNAKDKYGKGTNFSNSSAIARTYCTPDAQGHLFLIWAEVIIGYVTVGSKSFKRPPPNILTGHPYDTTVDSMTAPTIFVKYDKEEYYPEYIIEISA